MKRLISAVLVLSVIIITSANAAQQMAIWDFGKDANHFTTAPTAENVIGTPTLVLSGGTIDPSGKNGVAYTDAAGVSHIDGQAGAWDEIKISGDNARWIVTLNTTGWIDIGLRFDYKAWNSKTTSFDIDYRLNDTDAWTNILNNTPIVGDQTFHSFAYSLASLDAIENQSVVEFRFNDFDNKGSGKLAFDNFELTGTQIPEPATIGLFGLGITAIIRRRRK
ncbi:MAG: PEP-CTERM sorting domain-containing protein [Sedimentisphaerales bacterium]